MGGLGNGDGSDFCCVAFHGRDWNSLPSPIISWGVNFDLIYLLTKPNGQSYGADMPAYFSFIPDQVADALKASPFGIPYDDFIGYFPASTHQPAGN